MADSREELKRVLERAALPRTEPYPCPYLPDRRAVQFGFRSQRVDAETYHDLMDLGFRRSGRVFYAMDCPSCRACVPLRVPVATFRPSRSQRRVLRRNADVQMQLGAAEPTPAAAALYRRYLKERHPGTSQDDDVEALFDSAVHTLEARYTIAGELVAFSLIDASTRSWSSVYHCFEPALHRRSLGVYSALAEIEHARSIGVPHYYLGFWVEGSPTMHYKADYRPHERLVDDEWRRA